MVVIGADSRVHVAGSLEPYVHQFETELNRLNYTYFSAAAQMRLMAHLSRWLWNRNLLAGDLRRELIEEFCKERRSAYTSLLTPQALRPLLNLLAGLGVITEDAMVPDHDPDPPVLERFETYLRTERRLREISIQAQTSRIRRFLQRYTPPAGLKALGAAEVVQASLDEGKSRQPVSVKKFGYVLRSFLRYCFTAGELDSDLTGATLIVRLPVPSLLPRGVEAEQIRSLLGACDQNTLAGKRDFALLLLLARLGLRAGEVAGLRLADIDWRHGEILVRGKGSKPELLPMSTEIGEALVNYLQHRPAGIHLPEVFCTLKAPYRILSSPAVWAVVVRGCKKANVEPFGPHKLRHSLAESMVNAQVPLDAISQVLRHENPVTTVNYARVDLPRLRALCQAWPNEKSQP
ncbi:tyrosine-type recombinase/integrase [Glutamicibacter uratoxydans]|uniref:tyrosine-type recombinase/integrase n=1 Tax=Glutamicibacter uratoxydans TaxID=43667 RepID=UPI003D6EBBCD